MLPAHADQEVVLGRALERPQRAEADGGPTALPFLPGGGLGLLHDGAAPVRVDGVHGEAALRQLGAVAVRLVGSVPHYEVVLQWDVVISAVCCRVWHMFGLGVTDAAI